MRHRIERAEQEIKRGCLVTALWIVVGVAFYFWPLLIDQHADGSPQWWDWLIEIPLLIIALIVTGLVMSAREKRR